jgi:hypothetical protein
MTKNKPDHIQQKIRQVLDLLRFILPLDDTEITKSTLESVIEILEELI